LLCRHFWGKLELFLLSHRSPKEKTLSTARFTVSGQHEGQSLTHHKGVSNRI
jgi:hypothetical protein